LSSRSVFSVNLCPMPAGSRKLGSDAPSCILDPLPSGTGAATGLTFRCRVVARVRVEGAGPPGSWTRERRVMETSYERSEEKE
jgi:hypothetical protein